MLEPLAKGGSIKTAVEALAPSFGLETLYHLLQRMHSGLPAVRSALCQEQPAPASAQTDPLFQTVAHLQRLFPNRESLCAEFQWHFQRPLLE